MQIHPSQAAQAAAQAAMSASPLTTAGSGTTGTAGASGSTAGNSTSDSATITANDFLTLLVTEMQNQDPTADTDPNEYIDQLVQVNSLQQLISINQDLSGVSATANVAGTPSPTASATGATAPLTGAALTQAIADRLSPQAPPAVGAAGTLPNVSAAPAASASSAMTASAARVASALSPAAAAGNPDPALFSSAARPGRAAQP